MPERYRNRSNYGQIFAKNPLYFIDFPVEFVYQAKQGVHEVKLVWDIFIKENEVRFMGILRTSSRPIYKVAIGVTAVAFGLSACAGSADPADSGDSAAGTGTTSEGAASTVEAISYPAGTPLEAAAAAQCMVTGKDVSDMEIAYLPPATEFNYYLAIGAGIEALASANGMQYSLVAPAKDNPAEQIGMIQDITTRGVDIIVMSTHDPGAAAPVVAAAREAGIQIHLVNSDIPDFPTAVHSVVGYKQRAGDAKVGAYAVEVAGGSEVYYGILEGAPGYHNDERIGGWREGVSGASNFVEVASVNGGWNVDGGNAAAMDMLQANPQITVIFAANDYMAQGAVQAAKALGRDDIRIYSNDGDVNSGLEEIAAGNIAATLDTSPYAMGQIALQVAIDCATGAFGGGEFIESPGTVVDSGSVLSILCEPEKLFPAPNQEYSCN
jgi:ribose transport system substrate-binding protein